MTLQVRPRNGGDSGDDRFYNPNRDLAYCFRDMALATADMLAEESWPDHLRDYLEHHEIDEEMLGKASVAFCEFVCSSTNADETLQQALERVGWFKLPEAAQQAYLACLGRVVASYFIVCVRQATGLGEPPSFDAAELRQRAKEVAHVLCQSVWTRRWRRFIAWFRPKGGKK